MLAPQLLSNDQLNAVAALAPCSVNTLFRYLAGYPVRPPAHVGIPKALRMIGRADLVPAVDAAPVAEGNQVAP